MDRYGLPFIKFIIICVACVIDGCIPIPVSHDVPTETEATETIAGNIEELRLAPFYHKSEVKDFEREMTDVSDDIEIVKSTDLWKYAFPDRELDAETMLGELIEAATLASTEGLDVQSVIIISPPASSTGEDNFVFLGAAMGGSEERTTTISALVLDLEGAEKPEQVMTQAKGKTRAAWVFIPLPLINFFYWDFKADTEGSAKEGLAEALADSLVNEYAQRPVRITVLGALSGSGNTDMTDDGPGESNWSETNRYIYGLSPDELEWKASLGHSEAQLQLYWSLTTPDRLLWLCRSADQENPEAQKRLGILYANAVEGVPGDISWAYVWYSKAAANGDPHSGGTASRMLSRMNEKDSSIASERLAAWETGQCQAELQMLWITDAVSETNDLDNEPASP